MPHICASAGVLADILPILSASSDPAARHNADIGHLRLLPKKKSRAVFGITCGAQAMSLDELRGATEAGPEPRTCVEAFSLIMSNSGHKDFPYGGRLFRPRRRPSSS
jgi:hypothetical protein